MSNIEPKKVFIKSIPKNTTVDEIRAFFGLCGKVVSVHIGRVQKETPIFLKFIFAFVTYETQVEADRAVVELNAKKIKNSYGESNALTVGHSYVNESRKELPNPIVKEYRDLCVKYDENKEKIKQIYNNPQHEKEIEELQAKKHALEEKQIELKKTSEKIKGDIKLLNLQLTVKNLELENTELKETK